ncbi:MAG: RNA polymerase sigma factor [Prosthecobacter sp.]|uniref:RNA polymerase sigma factor n=1 Tax=Prosthecobacter sp. TaxID=1965333 RepID=UPI0038FEE31E
MTPPSSSTPPTDASLARLVERGDEAAFRKLMEQHLQRLRSFLALRAPVPDLIDEVAHDTFVFAYQNLGDFTEGSMQPWLRSIAHNLLRDRLKAYARETIKHERYSEMIRWEMTLGAVDKPVSDESDRLAACLEKLGPHQRTVLDLRYELQLSSDEIAQRTGRSTLAVRTLLMRVRQQLRKCIESQLQQTPA